MTGLERHTPLKRTPFVRTAPGPGFNEHRPDGMLHAERRRARRTGHHVPAVQPKPKASKNTNASKRVEALVWARAEIDGHPHCEICSRTFVGFRGRDYSLHHRLARSLGGSLDPAVIDSAANLLALCGSATTPGGCHAKTEAAPKHYTLEPGDDGRKIRHGQWAPTQVPVLLRYGWVLLGEDGTWSPASPSGVAA